MKLLIFLQFIFITFAMNVHSQSSVFQKRTFKGSGPITMPYRLLIPKNYDAKKSYPLVLAMQGLGDVGTDNEAPLKSSDLGYLWARDSNQAKFPSFIVVPQCPNDSRWTAWGKPVETPNIRYLGVRDMFSPGPGPFKIQN